MCRQCSEGVVESLRHMLCECGGYESVRGSWWDSMEPIVVAHKWGDVDKLLLMLGWRGKDVTGEEHARVVRESEAFFVRVWKQRATSQPGPCDSVARGVNDVSHGTT